MYCFEGRNMKDNHDSGVRVVPVSIDEWIRLTESGVNTVAKIVPEGNSMWPLIRSGKDMIEVMPADGPLKVNDIVVFRRADGRAVVHRIYRLDGNTVQTYGDNCAAPDAPVDRSQVVGVVTRIHRGTLAFAPEKTAWMAGAIRTSTSGIRKIKNSIKKVR